MPVITVKGGGTDIEAGAYYVTLTKVEGPKTIVPKQGPNAGQEIEVYDWTFQVDTGKHKGTDIEASSSANSGPRSKMFAWLTALGGGKAPKVGQDIDTDKLIGRRAVATVTRTDDGWARIESLGAMPADELAKSVAAATGAPTRGTPTASAPGEDDLPF